MSGWFAMKHGVSRHPLLKGKPERVAIWVWLVDNAVWKDTPHDVNGKTITIKRGQVAVSQRRLAEEVGVGRQVVRTFLDRLTTERMINPDPTHGKTIVTLCNYEKYQAALKADNPAPNPALTHDQPIKEQDNNIPVGTADKSASSGVVDLSSPEAAVWAIGKAYLGKHGISNPGALIGKFLKSGSAVDVLAAISSAERAKTQDPVPYITEAIKPKKVRFQDMSPREQAMALL